MRNGLAGCGTGWCKCGADLQMYRGTLHMCRQTLHMYRRSLLGCSGDWYECVGACVGADFVRGCTKVGSAVA